MTAYALASLMPVKIGGIEAGNITFVKTILFVAPIVNTDFIYRGSTPLTPLIVFINTGQRLAQKIITTFDVSPIPKNKIKTGNKARAEICLESCKIGSSNC